MIGISIIVCCYNSELRIDETLKHAFVLQVPEGYECEILLIDNNSSDGTQVTAIEAFSKYHQTFIDFRIIKEPRAGLTFARQRGITESKYNILLFCDDDNHLEQNYLIEAIKILKEKPMVGIIGGWCKPKLQIITSKWLEDFYGALAIDKNAGEDRFVNWVFGAGMILKKEIYSTLLQRNIQLLLTDRLGASQTSGGDTELCLLAKFTGYQIYYSSLLQLDHCIAITRLNRWNFFKTSHQNFYPVMYLSLLESFVLDNGKNVDKLFRHLLNTRLKGIFYFLPRCILGKHQYYSFISVYSNALYAAWLVMNKSDFYSTYKKIRNNLSL